MHASWGETTVPHQGGDRHVGDTHMVLWGARPLHTQHMRLSMIIIRPDYHILVQSHFIRIIRDTPRARNMVYYYSVEVGYKCGTFCIVCLTDSRRTYWFERWQERYYCVILIDLELPAKHLLQRSSQVRLRVQDSKSGTGYLCVHLSKQ